MKKKKEKDLRVNGMKENYPRGYVITQNNSIYVFCLLSHRSNRLNPSQNAYLFHAQSYRLADSVICEEKKCDDIKNLNQKH